MTKGLIIKTINDLVASYRKKNAVYELTHGKCLQFAQDIKRAAGSGELFYLLNEYHFVVKIDNDLYDATGSVTKKYKNEKKITYNEFTKRKKLVKMLEKES